MIIIKRTVLILVVLALLIAVLILSSLNADVVLLNFYFFQLNMSLGLALVSLMLCGVISGILLSYLLWIWPLRRQHNLLKKQTNIIKNQQQHPHD